MTAKIEELESALAAAHLQLHAATNGYVDRRPQTTVFTGRRRPLGQSSGSLAIDQDGVSKYYGDTAASEVCLPSHIYIRRLTGCASCSISPA